MKEDIAFILVKNQLCTVADLSQFELTVTFETSLTTLLTLFPLGGSRHVSHPVKLHTKIFLHQNFSLSGLRVSIADFGIEGPGFDSQ